MFIKTELILEEAISVNLDQLVNALSECVNLHGEEARVNFSIPENLKVAMVTITSELSENR